MSEFPLASLMPSFISTRHLPAFLQTSSACPIFPHLIMSLSNIVAHVQMDMVHAASFLARAQQLSVVSVSDQFLILPLQLLLSNIDPCMAARADGRFSPEGLLPLGVGYCPCTTDGGGACRYQPLTHSCEIEILIALEAPHLCDRSHLFLDSVSR